MAKGKELREICRKIKPILKKNGVVRAGIFGSYARGEQTKKSDIDILIKYRGKMNLLDLMGLELEIKKVLHRKVDLVTYKYIYPPLKKSILKDEVRIL